MRDLFRSTLFAFTMIASICGSSLWAADDVSLTPDVVYGHKHGLAMTLDVVTPSEKPNGAGVLFMVSGGWHSRWTPPAVSKQFCKPLSEAGFTVFVVRHGSSPKFKVPECVDDVRRAVRFVRLNAKQYAVDPERLGVYGFSAGGHLSLMLGCTSDAGNAKSPDPVLKTSDRVAAVVAFFGPTDLIPWVTPDSKYYHNFPALQFEASKAKDYSPLFHVSQDDPPTLLIHGDVDKLVPIDHSEKILKEFEKSKVTAELLVIEGAAHGFRGEDKQKTEAALVQWFTKHLVDRK